MKGLFPTWFLTLLLGIIVIFIALLSIGFGRRQKETVSDGDTITYFMEEWQKENDRLIQTLADMQKDFFERVSEVESRVTLLQARVDKGNWMRESEVGDGVTTPALVVKTGRPLLQERYQEILDMAEAGITLADIARKTGRGNGEVQLIIGLVSRGKTHG